MNAIKGNLTAAAIMAASVASSASLGKVVVNQMWPFSTKVAVDYELTCEPGESWDVALMVTDPLGNDVTGVTAAQSGDTEYVTSGAHRLIWDPAVCGLTNGAPMLRYQLSLRKPVGKKYLVMNLGQGESGWQEYDKTKPITIEYFDVAPSGGFNTATYRKFKIAFRRCRAGTYWMGSPETEDGRGENEKRHLVTLTNDFYLAILPLTGSHAWCLASQGGDHAWYGWENTFCHLSPIVTYRGLSTDAKWSSDSSVSETSFIGKIRNRMPTTGIGLPAGYVIDLPTEAQWEYACRAGTTSAFNNGEEPDYYDVYDVSGTYYPSATPVPGYKSCHTLDKLGRYCGNGGVWQQKNAPENQFGGKFAANAWGFYDMHGLYSEICLDTYVQDLGAEHQIEPSNRGTSGLQVVRGGGWLTSASSCRSACRSSHDLQRSHSNAYGVRLAIVPGKVD